MPVALWEVVRAALPSALIRDLRAQAADVYARVPDVPGFVPTASSVPLDPWRPTFDELVASPAMALVFATLGPRVWFNIDQAWMRRQYPPHRKPPHHAAHGWHQDGAIGHDFPAAGELLPTVTCWCPLDACGVGAPGIEIADLEVHTLRPIHHLGPDPGTALIVPELAPGDVLLMTGGTLHRTYTDPSMSGERTSVGLRFYGVIHPRMAANRHLRVETPTASSAD